MTGTLTLSEVDALINALDVRCDDKGWRWDLYRTHDRRWVGKISDSSDETTVSSPSMVGALEALLTVRPTIKVPPRPEPLGHVEIRKISSSKWAASTGGGRDTLVIRPTRREAEGVVEHLRRLREEEIARWDARWAELVHDLSREGEWVWQR